MKVGLVLPMATTDPERLLGFARRAEGLGFDGLFAFDHLFPPGAPADRPSFEAYTALAAVASVTRRIVVGTLVTRASLRSAGVVAKQAAALDDLSGGRFILGIGTGDALSRAEHAAFGLSYLGPDVRREHLVETVRAVRALFDGRSWEGGGHIPEMPGPLRPQPRSPGGPAIWIGGTSEAAARIAAAEADGWNGWGLPLAAFGRRVALLATEGRRLGRDPVATWGGAMVVGRDLDETGRLLQDRSRRGIATDVWAGDVAGAIAWLGDLRAAGAAWAIVLPAGAPDRMELIGERVLPRVRSAA